MLIFQFTLKFDIADQSYEYHNLSEDDTIMRVLTLPTTDQSYDY